MSKADLERLWEWAENIREEVGSLADEIAELYGAEEGDDLEAVLERSEPAASAFGRCKSLSMKREIR